MASPHSDEVEQADVAEGRRIRTAIAVCLLFGIIVVSLLVPIPIKGRAAVAIGDLAHTPLFGSIALGLLLVARVRMGDPLRIGIIFSIAVAVTLFGILIEVIQSLSGRMASLHDAVANGLGVIAAVLTLYAVSWRRISIVWAAAAAISAAGLFAFAWQRPVTILYDIVKAKIEFPVLAGFESNTELTRFFFYGTQARLVQQDATDGKYAMEVDFAESGIEGIEYPTARLYDFQLDWSEMTSLEMDLVLDESYTQKTLGLMIQVVDNYRGSEAHEYHFSRTVDLEPGKPQSFSVSRQDLVDGPTTGKLNLNFVTAIDFIALRPPETARVRIDSIRLMMADDNR